MTLAKLRADAAVFATDVSPGALEVARANAERHGAAVTFVEGDLDAPLAAHAPFSLIVANLPYIPTGDLASLPPDVRSEPALALDGGADGLDLVRRLVAAAPALLSPGGALALEIGAGQAEATSALLRAAGFTDVQTEGSRRHRTRGLGGQAMSEAQAASREDRRSRRPVHRHREGLLHAERVGAALPARRHRASAADLGDFAIVNSFSHIVNNTVVQGTIQARLEADGRGRRARRGGAARRPPPGSGAGAGDRAAAVRGRADDRGALARHRGCRCTSASPP